MQHLVIEYNLWESSNYRRNKKDRTCVNLYTHIWRSQLSSSKPNHQILNPNQMQYLVIEFNFWESSNYRRKKKDPTCVCVCVCVRERERRYRWIGFWKEKLLWQGGVDLSGDLIHGFKRFRCIRFFLSCKRRRNVQ